MDLFCSVQGQIRGSYEVLLCHAELSAFHHVEIPQVAGLYLVSEEKIENQS